MIVREYILDGEKHLIENLFVTAAHMMSVSQLAVKGRSEIGDEEGKAVPKEAKIPLDKLRIFKTQPKSATS